MSDSLEMETDDNFCGRRFRCMIYNIIISFWFDSENKEFFIVKVLNQLKEEVKPLDKSDLWYHTRVVYIQSFLLNEVGRKDESIIIF